MKVSIPVLAGNKGVREGGLAKTVQEFVDKAKPEACYFTSEGGKRTAYFIFDLKDPTFIPAIAEPFFSALEAAIDLMPVMNLEEMKVGVDKSHKR